MYDKYIVSFLIPALLIQLCGCYSLREISKDEMIKLKDEGDLIIYTKDSTIYSFKESNYHILNDSLYGKGYVKFSDDSDFNIEIEDTVALSNIEIIEREELNTDNTTLIIIGGILLVALVVGFIIYANQLSHI